jgi:hypothetical protein
MILLPAADSLIFLCGDIRAGFQGVFLSSQKKGIEKIGTINAASYSGRTMAEQHNV